MTFCIFLKAMSGNLLGEWTKGGEQFCQVQYDWLKVLVVQMTAHISVCEWKGESSDKGNDCWNGG